MLVPADPCDHDGKASGRLVLEARSVRREIVCECGAVLAVVGRDRHYLEVSIDVRSGDAG